MSFCNRLFAVLLIFPGLMDQAVEGRATCLSPFVTPSEMPLVAGHIFNRRPVYEHGLAAISVNESLGWLRYIFPVGSDRHRYFDAAGALTAFAFGGSRTT